jgi:hypothetical protein
LIERPQQCIPLLLMGVSYLLLCIHYHSSRHPVPWKRPTGGVTTVLRKVLMGDHRSPVSTREIAANEGIAEDARLTKLDEMKAQRMAALLSALLGFAYKSYKLYYSGAVDITTNRKINWNIFSGRLSPVYSVLLIVCKLIRYLRNLLTWQSAYTAKVTTWAVLLAAVWLVLPMNQVLQWYLRIVALFWLGPWMKWLDNRYFRSWYETKDELLERIDRGRCDNNGHVEPPSVPNFEPVLRNETFGRITERGRQQVEDLCKLRDMRTFRFGSYSVLVPSLDNSRLRSIPLPPSTAEIARQDDDKKDSNAANNSSSLRPVLCHLPGQRLYGNMIYSTGRISSTRNDSGTEDRARKQV